MTPVITSISDKITQLTEYHRGAKVKASNFEAYNSEIEGYMSTTLGFLFGQHSVETDL
jgi:hypothetical protein